MVLFRTAYDIEMPLVGFKLKSMSEAIAAHEEIRMERGATDQYSKLKNILSSRFRTSLPDLDSVQPSFQKIADPGKAKIQNVSIRRCLRGDAVKIGETADYLNDLIAKDRAAGIQISEEPILGELVDFLSDFAKTFKIDTPEASDASSREQRVHFFPNFCSFGSLKIYGKKKSGSPVIYC